MDTSKLLILGAGGQLGTALQQKYADATALSSKQLDITDESAVRDYDWSGVSTIINAAAFTNVDGAQTPEGRTAAWLINASGVANLARIASEHSLTLVHISSDYVFDGTAEGGHLETEKYAPLSIYGASKAAGDIAVSVTPKHYILRTSWVIGEGKNFVRTMMSLAEKDVSPTVVGDQMGRLTFTDTLVAAIDHLLTSQADYGIFNVSNSGDVVSWADITRAIFKELGRDDLTVTDTTTAEYFQHKPEAAPRPLNSELYLGKIKNTGFSPADWRDDLKAYIKKETSK